MTIVISSSRVWTSLTAGTNTPMFREFISTWTGMFSASGWIDTNASGSVDPTTIDAPSATNTHPAYQVWRFDDDLHHNGYPVYVKIEYGVESTIRTPSIMVSSGFWHNGSGSICPSALGVGCTPRIQATIDASGFNNTVQYTHRMCCISGSDLVALIADPAIDQSTRTSMFAVERIKDAGGNSTAEGVVVQTTLLGGSVGFRQTYFEYGPNSASQTPPTETIPNYILARASGVYNNDLTVGLLIPMLSASFGYPSRMAGFVQTASLAQGITHQLTLFNTSSTYYVSPSPSAEFADVHGRPLATGFRYIVRHE